MSNVVTSKEEKEFYVWIDEENPITKHNIEIAGYLFSIPEDEKYDVFPFIENPNKTGFMSQFIGNVIWAYRTEYNLELTRSINFKDCPSRFYALFLFETFDDAQKYAKIHPWHVGYRSLMKVKTYNEYIYSKHDIGWIDFLLGLGGQDKKLINDVTTDYWQGESIEGKTLIKMGKPYEANSNYELLYYGWVKPVETVQKGIDS